MDRSAATPFPPPVPHASATGQRRAGGVHRRPPGRLAGVLRSRRGRGYLAAASVVLLLVVTVTVLVAGRQLPETVVRDFHAALAARDAGAARMLLFSDVTVDKDVTLLTDAMLRSPGYTPPSRVRLTRLPAPQPHFPRAGEEKKEEEEALVRVDAELAGRAWQREVLLGRGGRYGDRWVMRSGPVGLGVTSSVRDGALIIAGTPYRYSGRELVVFPGAYQVALAEHPLFEADPVTALAGSSPQVPLAIRVRADVRQEVDRQIRAYLDACAGSWEVNVARCPLAGIMTLTLAQLRAARVSRTITRYPTVLVEENADIEHPLGFRTDMPGEIEVVIRTSRGGAPLINRTETLQVSGTVDLVGGAVVINPAF